MTLFLHLCELNCNNKIKYQIKSYYFMYFLNISEGIPAGILPDFLPGVLIRNNFRIFSKKLSKKKLLGISSGVSLKTPPEISSKDATPGDFFTEAQINFSKGFLRQFRFCFRNSLSNYCKSFSRGSSRYYYIYIRNFSHAFV